MLRVADDFPRMPKRNLAGAKEKCPGFCWRSARKDEMFRGRLSDRAVEREKRKRKRWASREADQGGPRQGAIDLMGGRTSVTCHGEPQRGQRSAAACPMRPMKAATDSMTSVSGGGTSSAARAAARAVFLRAGDSRP